MIGKADVAVVGGGIVGLAHAWQAAVRGCSVVLFERDAIAQGASARNFGMILPLGAAPGSTHEQALRSLSLWRQLVLDAGLWYRESGALMLAYHQDEVDAMCELADSDVGHEYRCTWMAGRTIGAKYSTVNTIGLLGGLWCRDVLLVDPREVVARVPAWLSEKHGVILRYGTEVQSVSSQNIATPHETWAVERTIVCPGADLDTLFADALSEASLTYCRLQMLRTIAQPTDWQLEPAILGGLSMRHYPVFKSCKATRTVARRVAKDSPELDRWGIHIMAVQNGRNEVVIGDSHEYNSAPKWQQRPEIVALLLRQLAGLTSPPSLMLDRKWTGVYVKHASRAAVVLRPKPTVRVITGLGGLGMTLSLALAGDVLTAW